MTDNVGRFPRRQHRTPPARPPARSFTVPFTEKQMRQIAGYISVAEPELSSSVADLCGRLGPPVLLDRFLLYCAGLNDGGPRVIWVEGTAPGRSALPAAQPQPTNRRRCGAHRGAPGFDGRRGRRDVPPAPECFRRRIVCLSGESQPRTAGEWLWTTTERLAIRRARSGTM